MSKQLDALKRYVEWFGEIHENCPGDDTCDCCGQFTNRIVGEFLTFPRYTTIRDLIKQYLEPLDEVEVEDNIKYDRTRRADSIITALYAVMTELDMPERYTLLKVKLGRKE